MIARFVTLMLIVMLALPVATLTRPAETSQSSWGTVAAKGKKHKNTKKAKTVTRTIRQPLTQTFISAEPIAIPDGRSMNSFGKASPYPSAIAVSGFANGTITDVNLILTDFTHTFPRDVDVLLSTNDGRRALVMSDVGLLAATDVDLTLDDEAAAPLPDTPFDPLRSGTFRPSNNPDGTDDPFDAPAPVPDSSVALSTFDGADPNGTWQVWVMDDAGNDIGELGGGWTLEITAEVDVQVPAKAKSKQHKKNGKGRHRSRRRAG